MIRRLLALLAGAFLATGAIDPNDPFDAATIDEHPGARIPLDRAFVTAAGGTTTLRQIGAGKPVLITPVQHECPNICGVTLAGVSAAIDGQTRYRPGRDFAVVALGIDPSEGPAQARDDLQRLAQQRPGVSWHPVALTGSATDVHAVTDALGYRYAWSDQLRQYAHMSATAVLTSDGRLSSWLYGVRPTSGELQTALTQAAAGQSGGVMQQILLLCFHYDPQTGRYSLAITKLLRAAGIATVLGIGLLLVLLSRKRSTAA